MVLTAVVAGINSARIEAHAISVGSAVGRATPPVAVATLIVQASRRTTVARKRSLPIATLPKTSGW